MMKKIILFLAAATMMASIAGAKTVKTTFKVNGNCTSMCKPTIEKTAKSIDGVISAKWSLKLKKLVLVYDDEKTNPKEVQKAIAAKGYDAGDIRASDETYNKLPQCCKYERTK